MSKESLNQRHYMINPTTAEDVEAMNVMHAKSWLETYPNEEYGVSREWVQERLAIRALPEAIEGRKKFIYDNKDNPANISILAKTPSGEIVGMAHGYRDEDAVQHLGSLYIDSDHHGTGVASDLMDQVIAWSDPTQPIYLGVVKYNERAQRFYQKYGFTTIEGSDQLYAEKMPEITMVRKGDAQ